MENCGTKFLSIHPLKGLNILNDGKIELENMKPNDFQFISPNELKQFLLFKKETDLFEYYSLLIDALISQDEQYSDSFLILCLSEKEMDLHDNIAQNIINCFSLIVFAATNFDYTFTHIDNSSYSYSHQILINLNNYDLEMQSFGCPKKTRGVFFNCYYFREDLVILTDFEYFKYFFEYAVIIRDKKIQNVLNLILKAIFEYNPAFQLFYSISSIDALLKKKNEFFSDFKNRLKDFLGDYLYDFYNYPDNRVQESKPYDLFEERHDVAHEGKQNVSLDRAHSSLRFAIFTLLLFCFNAKNRVNYEKFKQNFDPLILSIYNYFNSPSRPCLNTQNIQQTEIYEAICAYSILRDKDWQESINIFIALAPNKFQNTDFCINKLEVLKNDPKFKDILELYRSSRSFGIDKYKL